MKVKFTKLAALLLAGAALLAAGCTDYEVDIQNVDKKVDALATKTAADLQAQVAALNSTISTLETTLKNEHKADIDKLSGDIKTLETTLRNDYEQKIADAVKTLNAAIDLKVDQTEFDAAKKALQDALNEANKKIQALETADENFKKQIKDLTDDINAKLDTKADKTALAKAVEDLTSAIAAEEGRAKEAEKALQEAITKINEVTIPAINKQIEDLQNLKLDASTFNTYKAETAQTLGLMQDSIDELTALTAGFPEGTTIKKYVDGQYAEIIAKFDDYVLKTTFEEFVKIAATKAELKELEGAMNSKLEQLEKDLKKYADDQDEALKKAMTEYIDKAIKNLQGQLDQITNEEGTGRLDILEKVAEEYTKKVDDIIAELEFAEGDLQGYIDDADAATLEAACAYTDEQIEALRFELENYIVDLYNMVFAALQRVQSVVFVPTHDDLKITTNVAIVTQDAVNEAGQVERIAYYMGQPTEVTYKVTPTELAPWVADLVTDKELSQLYKEYLDWEQPAVFFDVKPLETRADEEEEETPELEIIGVTKADPVSGEITLVVMPWGIASPEFIANANKPSGTVELNGDAFGNTAFADSFQGLINKYLGAHGYTLSYWDAAELQAYMFRKPYAASLTVYCADVDNWNLYTSDGDLYMDDYVIFSNEVSSPYNVLYPETMTFDVLSDPYKPALDEEGKEILDEDGFHVLTKSVPEKQYLPYSSLRSNPVGELDSQNPKGYRIVLDQAQPAVSVNGSEPMLMVEASEKFGGLYYPIYYIEPVKFTVAQGTATAEVNEKNFVFTQPEGGFEEDIQFEEDGPTFDGYMVAPQYVEKYAEVEMSAEAPASQRKLAIGNIIDGTYTFTSFLGSFNAVGQVEITPALGEVDVDAEIVWTYKLDADTDHNRFYETGEEPTVYSRKNLVVNIDAEDMAYIDKNLDIQLDDFAGKDPKSYTITTTDAEGEVIDVKGQVYFPGEHPIKITADGKLTIDIEGFEFDKVYKIVAVYELPDATITVNGTITTIDRSRETVVIPAYEYTFDINEFDEETGFGFTEDKKYHWESTPMHAPIFEAFVNGGVVNVKENIDFAFNADQAKFNTAELIDKIAPGDPAGDAQYVQIANNGIYGYCDLTAAQLKEINTGVQDENDPYMFKGKKLVRYITTYIGETVEIPFYFNYRVPAYDFLHQTNFTFNDGNWYGMASPKYVLNKRSLQKYDVEYMNIPALAFNIIDAKNRFFNYKDEVTATDANYFYDKNLKINFFYSGPNPVDETPLESQSATARLTKYGDLWFDANEEAAEWQVVEADNFEHTVFYYRSTRDAIPMYGTLDIVSDGVRFRIPTSFEAENGGKYIAKQDYSDFELRAWKPFYVPTYDQTLYIDLDEHGKYTLNVLEGLQFFDGRQVAASTPVNEVKTPFVEGVYSLADFNNGTKAYFRPMLGEVNNNGTKVWSWLVGNANEAGTSMVPGAAANGYYNGVTSWEAYDLQTKNFVFDKSSGVPVDLRRLIEVNEQNYVMTFDYNSQIQFSKTAEVSFSFDFQSPWQKFDKPFNVVVVIRGLDAQ